jgi:hypothetical protein
MSETRGWGLEVGGEESLLWNGRGGSEVSTARVFREDFSAEKVRGQRRHGLCNFQVEPGWKLDEVPDVLVVEFEEQGSNLASVHGLDFFDQREEESGKVDLLFVG